MRGVSALIGEALDLARGKRAVLAEPCDQMEADGMADAVGDEGLLARAVEPDAAPADLRAAPCAQRFIQRVLLVSEAAADVGLDDLHIRPRAAERLRDNAANDVRDLRRAGHDDAAVLRIGEAAVIFNVAVLHSGGVVPAFDLDQPRLLNGSLIIAEPDGGLLENVVRRMLMELRRAALHGLLRVQHKRKLLIFDLDRAHGLRRPQRM